MEITITLPGGARVDAGCGTYTIRTDQPAAHGGEGAAPTPFQHFLASIGTCAGVYVLGFCRERGIPTADIRLVEKTIADPDTGLVKEIRIEVQLPPSFPDKYRDAVIRAADRCSVKRHLQRPPEISVTATVAALAH